MSRTTYVTVVKLLAAIIIALSYGSDSAAGAGRTGRPPATEFGTGPRRSAQSLYAATLKVEETLRPRKLYVVRVLITDAAGNAADNATIVIGGGMPEHHHGFPTRPRVTKNLGGGLYEISGLRFNMGGWWELKLLITSPSGNDTVTFNLNV